MDLVNREYLLQNDYIGPFPSWAVICSHRKKLCISEKDLPSLPVVCLPAEALFCHHGISHNECLRARHSFCYERGIEIGSYPWNSLILPCAALSSRLDSFIEQPVWVHYGFQLRNNILWVWGAFPSGYRALHETLAEPPVTGSWDYPLPLRAHHTELIVSKCHCTDHVVSAQAWRNAWIVIIQSRKDRLYLQTNQQQT